VATLNDITELADGDTASSVSLSPESLATLEYALSFLESLTAWEPNDGHSFTPTEIDDILELVARAGRELNGF